MTTAIQKVVNNQLKHRLRFSSPSEEERKTLTAKIPVLEAALQENKSKCFPRVAYLEDKEVAQ